MSRPREIPVQLPPDIAEHIRGLHGLGSTAMMREATDDRRAVEFQSRADQVYAAHNLRAPARVVGESIDNYRRRLLTPLVQHSPRWQQATLGTLAGVALDVAEEHVFADSVRAATRSGAGTGPLREVVTNDDAGRRIKRFYGDPAECWDPFKYPARAVIGFPGARL